MAKHWVPQHVLRGFSADGVHIWQYDKKGETGPKKVPIKVACGRRDAFAAPVERLLSTIEIAANPAINVFRRMKHALGIDPVAKRIVAVYLTAFLWKRSPAIRDQQIAKTTEEELLAAGRDAMRRYGPPRSLYQDRLPAVVAKAASDVNQLMADHWQSSSFQRCLISSMSWAVLHCAEPTVTIPDCGMVRLGGRGILDPKAEFYFPLNATRVLIASWHGTPPDKVQLLRASPAHVRHINKLGFGQAGRFVYGRARSEKLAMAVRRPSPHFTRLKDLDAAGGPNPTATSLDGLSKWCAKMKDGQSDHPDRHWCVAPGAAGQCRHGWRQLPFPLPVIREAPQVEVSARICQWCGAVERRYSNGEIEFDDLELRRTTANESTQNWWQSFRIEGTDTRIKAHGTVPRYHFVD